jgi:hypothetical protein
MGGEDKWRNSDEFDLWSRSRVVYKGKFLSGTWARNEACQSREAEVCQADGCDKCEFGLDSMICQVCTRFRARKRNAPLLFKGAF